MSGTAGNALLAADAICGTRRVLAWAPSWVGSMGLVTRSKPRRSPRVEVLINTGAYGHHFQ